MRVLILSQNFPPEPGSCSAKMYEMAEYLSQKGHHVSVITQIPNYPTGIVFPGYKKLYIREKLRGIDVHRIFVYASPKRKKFLPRFLNDFTFMITSIFGALRAGKHDVIYVYSPPLFSGISAFFISRLYHIPFIFMVNDLWPKAAIFLGFLKNKKLIWLAEHMERFIYDKAERIFVYSEKMGQEITNTGIRRKKIEVHPLWIDTRFFKPLQGITEIRKKHGFERKFVVLYAGSMGLAQGIDNLIESARILQNKNNISFVLVGGGIKREKLIQLKDRYALKNVKFINPQPIETMPYFFSAADVLFVHLNKAPHRVGTIPEKALAYMSCGKPILMAAEGAAAELVQKHDCGISVEPQNPKAIADGILLLYQDERLRERLGRNARKAAVNFFDKNLVLGNIERQLKEIVSQTDCG